MLKGFLAIFVENFNTKCYIYEVKSDGGDIRASFTVIKILS